MTSHSASPRKQTPLHMGIILLSVLCVLLLLAPSAFARTYVITDGDRTITYITFATDPAEILESAGMDLSEHDTYTTAAGDTITIRRALEVTLSYRGETSLVTSGGETVGFLTYSMSSITCLIFNCRIPPWVKVNYYICTS